MSASLATPPLPFSGVILAGGRSSRMGRDKALLSFAGAPLVARQATILRNLGAKELLLSGRPQVDYGILDARLVLDSVPDSGPLAGLVACLETARTDWVLALAVDLPHLTPEYLRILLNMALTTQVGVVPEGPDGFEPLAAVYPRLALPLAQRFLSERRLSLQPFVRALIVSNLAKPLPIRGKDLHQFTNWNTPDDLPA